MRFTRLILALTSFLILITQTDLFASTVLHKTSMVDLSNNAIICCLLYTSDAADEL
mgnify:CR=1 FL=1